MGSGVQEGGVGTVNSAKAFWEQELPRYGKQFREPGTIIYNGSTQSACGTASNQVGPFYCPLDEKIYIDASFFDLLTYVADLGRPLRAHETVGRNAAEKLRVKYVRSPIDPKARVWRVELP